MAHYAEARDTVDPPVTDEDLIERVAQGDSLAFELLVQRYQAPALRAAYRFIGNAHSAEDIAQETFLRVYRNAHLYKPLASFKTWFYLILGNLCRDAIKKKSRVYQASLAQDTASGFNLNEDLEREERNRRIQRAIIKLAPQQRLALILCHYEGLTYAEAAKSLDVSVKAVESLLVRAKRTLRRDLADLYRRFYGLTAGFSRLSRIKGKQHELLEIKKAARQLRERTSRCGKAPEGRGASARVPGLLERVGADWQAQPTA